MSLNRNIDIHQVDQFGNNVVTFAEKINSASLSKIKNIVDKENSPITKHFCTSSEFIGSRVCNRSPFTQEIKNQFANLVEEEKNLSLLENHENLLFSIAKNPLSEEELPEYLRILNDANYNFAQVECLCSNTPALWAVANAHHRTARAIFEYTSLEGLSHISQQNNVITLLLAKGYKTRSRDGDVIPENFSNTDLIRYLVEERGLDPRVDAGDGFTPLQLACLHHDLSSIEALLNSPKITIEDLNNLEHFLEIPLENAENILRKKAVVFLLDRRTGNKDKIETRIQEKRKDLSEK